MNLNQHIKTLLAIPETDAPFISLYLNVAGDETLRQEADNYLKKQLAYFQKEYPEKSQHEIEFSNSWHMIENFLNLNLETKTRSVAIFARWDAEEPFFLALQFPVHLENEFRVDRVPHIFPLVEFLDNAYHYLVMVSDTEKAKIFEIQFGGIEDIQRIEKEEDEKSFRGEWSKIHYQNWKRDQTRRFTKTKLELIEKLMRTRHIDHLVLAGDEPTLNRVRKEMSPWLLERVVDFAKMDYNTPGEDIIEQTLQTFADYEKAESLDAISSRQYEVATNGLGVLGLENTSRALDHAKVDMLIIDANLNGPRDELARKALQYGASVETISDNEWLQKHGGVGALLRYK